MSIKRRSVLIGAGAFAAVASVPVFSDGIKGHLARLVQDHFGEDLLKTIPGVDTFVQEFAAGLASDNTKKRLAAQVYFGFYGDKIAPTGFSNDLDERFLRTLLTRSNIIAIRTGRATEFDYGDPNAWETICGNYLSADAARSLNGTD